MIQSALEQKAISTAYLVAKDMQKPYLSLCTDIRIHHPYTYEAIESNALMRNDDRAFLLKYGAQMLKPYVLDYFENLDFPYSFIGVDGIRRNGAVNIALWITKPGLEQVSAKDIQYVLDSANVVQVMKKIENWGELECLIGTKEANWQRINRRQSSRGNPYLLRSVYEYGINTEMTKHVTNIFPPMVWHLYGEEPAPQSILDGYIEFHQKPEKFIPLELRTLDD